MQGSLPLNGVVAEMVRRELAAKRISKARLARAIGKDPMWVSRRLNGDVPFDLSDLELIARELEVQVGQLLPAEARA